MRLICFTAAAGAADNRGSLSIKQRLALAVKFQQGTSSRQIIGGLRMGAGCLPSSGVSGSSNAPDGLFAVESAPTRFSLSAIPRGTPVKAVMARLAFLSKQTERASHA